MQYDILAFWQTTPYELGLMVDSYIEHMKLDQEERISLAYATAAWAAQWFGKKRPDSLDKILGKSGKKKKMSDEQMLEMVKGLHEAITKKGSEKNGN